MGNEWRNCVRCSQYECCLSDDGLVEVKMDDNNIFAYPKPDYECIKGKWSKELKGGE